MSIPIRYCALVRAVDDPEAFKKLHPVMFANLNKGHFTLLSCGCDPQCRELSDAECDDLQKRLRAKPERDA